MVTKDTCTKVTMVTPSPLLLFSWTLFPLCLENPLWGTRRVMRRKTGVYLQDTLHRVKIQDSLYALYVSSYKYETCRFCTNFQRNYGTKSLLISVSLPSAMCNVCEVCTSNLSQRRRRIVITLTVQFLYLIVLVLYWLKVYGTKLELKCGTFQCFTSLPT